MGAMRKKKDLSLFDCWRVLNEYHAKTTFDRPISKALEHSTSIALGYLATYANHAHHGNYKSLERLDRMCEEL